MDKRFYKEASLLHELIENFRWSRNIEDFSNECQEFGNVLSEAYPIFQDFIAWDKESKIRFRDYLFNNSLLRDDEKTEDFLNKFNYDWIDAAKRSVYDKSFQIYNFGSAFKTILDVGHSIPYSISDALCVSDDINLCIGQNSFANDKCHVQIAFKIDSQLLFSYFIISVKYHDRIWLATDRPIFPSPAFRNKAHNPYRFREDTYENVRLPYNIIDDIEKWRTESRDLAKQNGSELYVKSIREYLPAASKVFLKLIIEEIIYNVIPRNQFSFDKIAIASDNIKLLGSDRTMLDDGTDIFAQINREANEVRLNNIVFPNSSEIIKIDPISAVAEFQELNTLSTVAEIRRNAIWAQKEEQRRRKQKIHQGDDG